MYGRSHTMTLSFPTNDSNSHHFSQFGYKPMGRSTEPEVFTFDHIPTHVAPNRSLPVRQRKRVTRVMYPSKVRKYLPPAEKSPAKRWLLALCLVVFLQIYTEEATVETPTQGLVVDPVVELHSEDTKTSSRASTASSSSSLALYNVLPFQSAEDQARQMMMMTGCPEDSFQTYSESHWSRWINKTCPSSNWEPEMTTMSRQSARNGYVVALLYPVYHTLGSEQ